MTFRSQRLGGMASTRAMSAAKQRMDGGQSGVAAAHAVATLVLEVVQERADQLRVEIFEVKKRRCPACLPGRKHQQQSQGVAVGGNGVRAGALLPGEAVGEECLQGRGQRGHEGAAALCCSQQSDPRSAGHDAAKVCRL